MTRKPGRTDPNRIVEVYGQFKNPAGNTCALVKTQGGAAYYVLPAETGGAMPKVGALLDPTKHEIRKSYAFSATETPTAIEALEGAIEMLQTIASGGSYTAAQFHDRLRAIERARDAHRDQEMKDDRTRQQLRQLGAEMRGLTADMNATVDRSRRSA